MSNGKKGRRETLFRSICAEIQFGMPAYSDRKFPVFPQIVEPVSGTSSVCPPVRHKLADARINLLQIESVRIKLRILLEPPRGPFQSLIQHFLQQIWICCKHSLTIQDVVSHAISSLLWNVAKIFFATDPS